MENPDQDVVATQMSEPAALRQRPPQDQRVPDVAVFNTQNVSIYYSAFRAVTDVSLSIYQNEITAFIGPSGCGKTTVLRTLNRMNDLIPGARVEGDVHYHGMSLYSRDVSATAVRRRIGTGVESRHP